MTGPGPGQVLFEFVRHWSRRAPGTEHNHADQGRLVLVTEAVHALAQRGTAPTVNAVAYEIGIDQSGASRLIKTAVDAGYLEKVFGRLTQDWSEQRRRDFQDTMTDLLNRSHASDAGSS